MWLRFGAVSLTWGASFLMMKLALEGMGVYQVAFARNLLGAAALVILLLATRQRLMLDWRRAGHSVVVAALLNVAPALLYAWAETGLSSGMASIYNATTPLMTLLVGLLAFRTEKSTRRKLLALGLGLGGVVVVAAPSVGGGGPLGTHLACLGATACYGAAYGYIRKFLATPSSNPLGQTALQLLLAVVLLLPGVFLWGASPIDFTPRVAVGILVLGIAGTGMCFAWNNTLIAEWSPSRAATTTYITPAVGVLLGALVLGEPLGWNLPAGLLLILGSVVLGREHPGPAATGSEVVPIGGESLHSGPGEPHVDLGLAAAKTTAGSSHPTPVRGATGRFD